MADYEPGESARGKGNWIVTGELGEHAWQKVNNSARVDFGDKASIAILFKLVRFGDDTNLIRKSGFEYEEGDWAEPFSLMNPDMAMSFSFDFKAGFTGREGEPKEIRMATYAYTSNGAMFTNEFYQDKNEPAEALFRIPIPQSMRGEVQEIADNEPKCRMAREQMRTFQERFADDDDFDSPSSYMHPHLKCENMDSLDELKRHFDKAIDVTERGVRASGGQI
jgi:hypothetical protein